MISHEKVVNNKVIEANDIYNFCIGHFSIRLCLNNSKFEFQNTRKANQILGYLTVSDGEDVN